MEDQREDGYYDDLDLDIDENLLEGIIMIGLVGVLLVLVYVRQQRIRQRANANNEAARGVGGDDGGGAANAGAGGGRENDDRGFFPRPEDPEFAQWVAGGVGH